MSDVLSECELEEAEAETRDGDAMALVIVAFRILAPADVECERPIATRSAGMLGHESRDEVVQLTAGQVDARDIVRVES
jgi:hypothetical protein